MKRQVTTGVLLAIGLFVSETNGSAQTTIFGLTLGQPVPMGPLCSKRVSEACLDQKKETWRHPGVAEQLVYVTVLRDGSGPPTVEQIRAWWNGPDCSDAMVRLANTLGQTPTKTQKVARVKNNASAGGYQTMMQMTLTWPIADGIATFVVPTDNATCEVTVESSRYRSHVALETERRLREKGQF